MTSPQLNHFDYTPPPDFDLERLIAGDDELQDYARDLEDLSMEELQLLRWRMYWRSEAREKQLPPREFDSFLKTIWGIRSGRGFGKTLMAANWAGITCAMTEQTICHVVAPTHDDVRHTCFEGSTGLLAVIPPALILDTNAGLPSITLWNNSFIRGFSGDNPERLRGPQCHIAWCDEIASWRYPDDAWDNLQFGLRLGKHPRMVWTGTPKATPFMRKLVKNPSSVVVQGTTYENRDNLAQTFYDNVAKYEGTKIGRQELLGEILDPEEEGIVKRSQWRLWPNEDPLPKFHAIIMSLDTAFTEKTHDKKKQENDPSACSVWGVFTHPDEGTKCAMLLDCWEEWLGFTDLVKTVKRERKIRYGEADEPIIRSRLIPSGERAGPTGKAIDIILIEDIGSGKSLRQQLAREEVLTSAYNPGKMDKLSRLHAVSPMYAHGRVFCIESDAKNEQPKSWADPLITQVCSYTGEGSLEHDDLLDTSTQALKLIMDKFLDALTVKRDVEEERRQAARAEAIRRERRNPYDG